MRTQIKILIIILFYVSNSYAGTPITPYTLLEPPFKRILTHSEITPEIIIKNELVKVKITSNVEGEFFEELCEFNWKGLIFRTSKKSIESPIIYEENYYDYNSKNLLIYKKSIHKFETEIMQEIDSLSYDSTGEIIEHKRYVVDNQQPEKIAFHFITKNIQQG
jgi:hypothetical protein